MTGDDPEMTAYMLLATYGMSSVDLVIRECDDAAGVGAEDDLSFWNSVLDVIYGWA